MAAGGGGYWLRKRVGFVVRSHGNILTNAATWGLLGWGVVSWDIGGPHSDECGYLEGLGISEGHILTNAATWGGLVAERGGCGEVVWPHSDECGYRLRRARALRVALGMKEAG